MSKIRQQRTADQIHLILSELMLRHMNDPRLLDLTITEVTIDRELKYADVYVQALGDDARQADVMAALENAAGFFRHELALRMRLRSTPQLHFHWDPRLAHVEEIDKILGTLDIPPAEDDEES
ncbi:MAG: 30S ribosome-binding factor RbfA [Ardenticatenaceae bacterium]|nr:30S ribosome-binding factor RbfA [Ardenticatenaceae bacterium]MCB9443814.1 30S ribosome-binding factor RbfA [Ardenticatenaceae bacterium]